MHMDACQTHGETRLDIRLGSDEVRHETAEVQETTVVLEPLRDNDASAAAIENARLELRDRGHGHEVVIDVRDRGRGLFRNAEVLIAVTCPEGASVETKSGSADVEVHGRFGAVEVETGSGDQEIGSASTGSVTLKSASGDLKVGIKEGSTLWVDARSRSGEVRSELPVSDLPPDGDGPTVELRANTMSGDITVTRA